MGDLSDSAPSIDGSSNLNMEVDSLEEVVLSRDMREVLVDPTSVDFRERFKMLQVGWLLNGSWDHLRDANDFLLLLQIERQRIRITSILREGKFGRLFRGWIQGDKKRLDQQVGAGDKDVPFGQIGLCFRFQIIIKTVKEGSPADEEQSLCREGARLFNILHNHILSLHGVSFAEGSPSFLIYADHGSSILKT